MKAPIFYCCVSLVAAACGDVHVSQQDVVATAVDGGVGAIANASAVGVPAAEALPGTAKERLLQALSRPSEKLTLERGPDGISRVDLRGRIQSASFVVKDADGHWQRQCIDHPATIIRLLGGSP